MGTEQATCRECGGEFERAVTRVGDRVLRDPSGLCPACYDEIQRAEQEAAAPRGGASPLDRLKATGVNTRKHGRCRFGAWEADDSSAPRQACETFVAEVLAAGRHDFVRSVYLCGPTGTGKTHLAVAVLAALLEADTQPTMTFDRADRLITEIQDSYGTGKTEAVLTRREEVGVWVLDDLGAEKATPDVLRILTDLLSAREGHPNVVTSNLDPGALAKRWEVDGWARLSSRLATQNFRTLRVSGADRRFQRGAVPDAS